MLYVPRHLPNKLEYKVLSCISVHYQSRMTSNGIAITPPHPLTVQTGQYGGSPRLINLRWDFSTVYYKCFLHTVFSIQ